MAVPWRKHHQIWAWYFREDFNEFILIIHWPQTSAAFASGPAGKYSLLGEELQLAFCFLPQKNDLCLFWHLVNCVVWDLDSSQTWDVSIWSTITATLSYLSCSLCLNTRTVIDFHHISLTRSLCLYLSCLLFQSSLPTLFSLGFWFPIMPASIWLYVLKHWNFPQLPVGKEISTRGSNSL